MQSEVKIIHIIVQNNTYNCNLHKIEIVFRPQDICHELIYLNYSFLEVIKYNVHINIKIELIWWDVEGMAVIDGEETSKVAVT